jgi:nitrous oxidase accessory protein NosD
MTVAVAALAALALSLPASSYANRTVTVSSGESIQAAIDAAKPGTTINIAPGTYHESLIVKTNGIKLVGAGRKLTKLVPPDPLVVGQGCVDTEQREPPPAPPTTVASGICVANVDAQFNPLGTVENVEIRNLTVTGFNEFGILFFGSKNGLVKRVIASDNTEYGVFANTSSGTTIARSVFGNNGEAGIYVGDSPNADATVWKNVSYGNVNGIFLRDAAHGKVIGNKSFGNCVGVLFLNTPEQPPAPSVDVEDWLAAHNNTTANNKACPGGGEEDAPPTSGTGFAVIGGIDIHIIDNGVFGNVPDATITSPFSGGIVVGESSKGTRVGFNTVIANKPFDLVSDGTGEDNQFFKNDCLTSQPDGLCVDDDSDQGDNHGNGEGDSEHHGDNGGHADDNHHGRHDNGKKHGKQHRKHKKHHRGKH